MTETDGKESLYSIAMRYFIECGRDYDRALAALCAGPECRTHARELAASAWQTLLGRILSAQRNAVMGGRENLASHVVLDGRKTWERRARESDALLNIMQWWYVGTVPLGECLPEHLREDIQRRQADAATTLANARFEARVLEGMKPGKRVKECYSAQQLAKLAKEESIEPMGRERSNGARIAGKRSRQVNQTHGSEAATP